MQFDTPVYIAFLAIIVCLYWRLRGCAQNLFLLAASYFFYGWWNWRFLGLIMMSSVVDYHCARWIEASPDHRIRRLYLSLSVLVNLSVLGLFKYFNFFVDSFITVMAHLGIRGISPPALRLILPPAVSFYTFQELAYIVEVFRKRLAPSRSLINYALFVSLFPHLIAGPIQQPSHLLPQVEGERVLDWSRFLDGLLLIIMGLFRKCVIANNCALLANAAFDGRLGPPSLGVLALGTYAFAWQIYADFSGYSDIARGSAQLLGFHFMVNFRQPYLAWSLQEFWRRWHISLSNWLRDYLFLPVSYWASRKVEALPIGWMRSDLFLYAFAAVATMLLGGLWHGANWTFVIWGGYFGVGLAVERILWSRARGRRNPLRATRWKLLSVSGVLRRVFVFHLVCFSWILFRAESLAKVKLLLSGIGNTRWQAICGPAFLFLGVYALLMSGVDLVNEIREEEYLLQRSSVRARVSLGLVALAAMALFSGNEASAFVYFQF